MKQIYRVVFKNTWNSPLDIEKIVVTSNIEKSVARLRKRFEGQILSNAPASKISAHITLVRIKLVGPATIHE